MADDIQQLIERIQKEALAEAEAKANQLLEQARDKAAAIVREAEAKAKAIVEKAERDSQVFVERAQRTLEQAARDLLITVGQGIENILEDIVGEALDRAMDDDFLKEILLKMAQSYVERGGAESRIEFLIGERDQAQVIRFFAEKYREKLVKGVEIHTDTGIFEGFRVVLSDQHVVHDFTKPAIAEALCAFLRPHLAEIVHRAAEESEVGSEEEQEEARKKEDEKPDADRKDAGA
jgi:V/A-type H+-transporting ATPase subunit E